MTTSSDDTASNNISVSEELDHAPCPNGIDPASWQRWTRVCAAMPPMTEEQITIIAAILNRIDRHNSR